MDPATWAAHGAMKGRPKRPPPNLPFREDSESAKLWRAGERPAATVQIPKELVYQQEKFYHVIAKQYGTFIYTCTLDGEERKMERRDNSGRLLFGIWGEGTAATKTQKQIDSLISEWFQPKKSARSARFARLVSLNETDYKSAEKRWRNEVRRQKYRMHPLPGTTFGAIATFHWPFQEYRPDEVLGPNLEALDPIRMDCSCHVTFHPEIPGFRIYGQSEKVQMGLLRLRKALFQLAAREVAPVRQYLLHWPEDTQVPSTVILTQYERPLVTSGSPSTVATQGSSVQGTDDGQCAEGFAKALTESNLRGLMLATIPKLHYYRGSLKLRIHLGTFLATQFKKVTENIYTISEYEYMIKESQFTGQVTTELGDKEIEQNALKTLQQADDLLVPQHALTHDLTDVRPVYSVVFTFADTAGNLRLAIDWEETMDEGSTSAAFEIVSQKWSRLERDTGTAATVVDVSLKNVVTGFAWHFDLRAAQPVDEARLSPELTEFAHNVKIDAIAASKNPFAAVFIKFKPFQGHMKSLHQSTRYRFGIKGSALTVELSRFQEITFSPRRSLLLAPEKAPVVYEPRWSLDVYNTEWDRLFTRNERLEIGKRADWEDGVETWFPEDIGNDDDSEKKRDGFEQMMDKLNRLAKLIESAKEEDLIGGMSVG